MQTRRRRGRGGATLVEVMVACTIASMVMTALVALVRFANVMWYQGGTEESTKQVLALAVGQMEPIIRSALRVNVAQSDGDTLTLVLPRVDSATGDYALPLADGDMVSFYLSNTTGSTDVPGTILWRSVNGTPDAAWSLRGSRGRVDLGSAGLTFTYNPAATPRSVVISVTTTQRAAETTLSREASTEVVLRNRRDNAQDGVW